ncbi:unnamed protein product [Urochloa humidicola]
MQARASTTGEASDGWSEPGPWQPYPGANRGGAAIASASGGSRIEGSTLSASFYCWSEIDGGVVARSRFPGSTLLHLPARSRNLDCIREVLA